MGFLSYSVAGAILFYCCYLCYYALKFRKSPRYANAYIGLGLCLSALTQVMSQGWIWSNTLMVIASLVIILSDFNATRKADALKKAQSELDAPKTFAETSVAIAQGRINSKSEG